MDINGKIVVVTGAASGIGRALARRFAADGARCVVVADIDGYGAQAVADEIGGRAEQIDVTDENAQIGLIERTEAEAGPIELWCGNAGVGSEGGLDLDNAAWRFSWEVNVMAHVISGRHLIPRWIERGSGHLMITASAAGLLTNLGTAPYAVTKHGAVALAEWIAVTHGHQGIRVSCLCPQGVRTPMTEDEGRLAVDVVRAEGMLEPEDVADVVAESLADDRFLILPHPAVKTYEQRRAGDRERWLSGMQRLQASLLSPSRPAGTRNP